MDSVVIPDSMQSQLKRLRDAERSEGVADAATRIARLRRCIDLLVENQDDLARALDEDFNGRSPYLSKMS